VFCKYLYELGLKTPKVRLCKFLSIFSVNISDVRLYVYFYIIT